MTRTADPNTVTLPERKMIMTALDTEMVILRVIVIKKMISIAADTKTNIITSAAKIAETKLKMLTTIYTVLSG